MDPTEQATSAENKSPDAGNNSDSILKNTETAHIVAEVDITKKPTEEKRTINLLNDDELGKKASAKTEQDIKNPEAKTPPVNVDEYKRKLEEDGKKSASNITMAQYEQQASGLIAVIDFILVAIFRAFAHDAKDTAYIIRDDKKEVLKEQLKNVLILYSAAFPLVAIFLITIFACYMTPAKLAWDNRQLYLQEKEKNKKKKSEKESDNDETAAPRKRRPGGQPKA